MTREQSDIEQFSLTMSIANIWLGAVHAKELCLVIYMVQVKVSMLKT